MSRTALADSRRQASSGQVEVDDYIGRPAEEAGWLVRRLGLRPGMSQSFGCEPALHGHVVAQHPAPGQSTLRNTIVELHIGVAEQPPGEHDEQQTSAHYEPAEVQADTQETEPPRPRSRKAHRARTRSAFDTPPAPRLPVREQPPATEPAQPERSPDGSLTERTDTEDTVAIEHEHDDIAGHCDLDYTELLAASQLFSAHTRTRALRLDDSARRRLRALRGRAAGRARRHPALVLALTLALGAWALVGLTRPAAHNAARAQTPTPPRTLGSRHPHRTSRVHETRRQPPTGHARVRIPRRSTRGALEAQTVPAEASGGPAQPPAPEPPAPPAAPPRPPPAAAQSGGGPFSP